MFHGSPTPTSHAFFVSKLQNFARLTQIVALVICARRRCERRERCLGRVAAGGARLGTPHFLAVAVVDPALGGPELDARRLAAHEAGVVGRDGDAHLGGRPDAAVLDEGDARVDVAPRGGGEKHVLLDVGAPDEVGRVRLGELRQQPRAQLVQVDVQREPAAEARVGRAERVVRQRPARRAERVVGW